MKKSILVLTMAVAVLLAGCGKNKNNETPISPEEEAKLSGGVTINFVEDSQAVDRAAVAADLVRAYNIAERILSSALECDRDTFFVTDDGYSYVLVKDKRFKNVDDISECLKGFSSNSLYNSRYKNVLEGQNAKYIDVAGKLGYTDGLYMVDGGRGILFLDEDKTPVITSFDDNSFIATVTYDNFGSTEKATIRAIFDNGYWKLDSVEFEY